jgi:parallel beta-helix repeat protein
MTAQTISVKNLTQLNAALKISTGGETIVLTAGNYGNLSLSKLKFDQQVTIKGGTFSSVALVGVKGITLDHTTVNFSPTATSTSDSQAIRVSGATDIAITNAHITGGKSINGVASDATLLDATGNVLGLPVGKGIYIGFSSGVTVSGSDLSLFHKGIVMAGSSDIVISNNQIHDLRTTPISGSVTANLTITGNHTYNSNPWNYGGDGDHGDRIHIWTDKTAISGLSITNNNLEQGAGAPMLGIYLDDNNKGLGFVKSVISGNRLTDGQGQGVLLENVSGTVSNNTLVWSGYGSALNNTPRFDIKSGSHDLSLSGNSGPISIREGVFNIQVADQNGTAAVDKNLSASALDSIVFDFQTITAHNSFTLAAGTTDLIFVGAGDFNGIGNALSNHIVGGDGNDILIGNGGVDVLEGRLGDDFYYVDNLKQTIIDTGGTDAVMSSIGWKLQAGLENLIYTGTAGVTLEGNQANNHIVGGIGDDTLIANGGRDLLEGGRGNDTYVLDYMSHTIIDTGGTDTVIVPLSYTLAAGLENLTLSGSNNISGTGNDAANVLIGNAGNNVLDGGAGADAMFGGSGNDTYIVDNVDDRCVEVDNGNDAGGIDLVKSFISSFMLDQGIENLTYVGTGDFRGRGNDLANVIRSGVGNDHLFGGGDRDILFGGVGSDVLDGGSGADMLTGGTGNDIFVFRKGEANGDLITDFVGNGAATGDSIQLTGWGEYTTFTKMTAANVWKITDGVDHHIELVSIVGSIFPSDISFLYG